MEKEILRQELDLLFGISEQSLFPDMNGFSAANSQSTPIPRLNDPKYYLLQGNELFQHGEYRKAIGAYGESIQIDSISPFAYYLRGNANASIQDYSRARDDYDLALKQLDRAELSASLAKQIVAHYRSMNLFNRGNACFAMEEYKESVVNYEEAIESSTLDKEGVIYFNLANARVKLRDFHGALKNYDQAVQRNVQYARFNRGNALLLLGRFEEALASYTDERQRFDFEKADNNIAVLHDAIRRSEDHQVTFRIAEEIGSLNPAQEANEYSTRNNKSVPDNTQHSRQPQNSITFICTGNVGNVGNFGGGDTSGGSGLPGERPFFLVVASQLNTA